MAGLSKGRAPGRDPALLDLADKYAQFLACGADGRAAGFVEASLRTDYVNGTDSSPVAFLEDIYVAPAYRRQGVGRLLTERVVYIRNSLPSS